ncbi:hypothetical protein [Pseudomonas aeruginosa]|uniref:hypothetical protein n=1 Tax=Pseudomonas aeruginosa TaxID=287 RepID=UPI003891C0E8
MVPVSATEMSTVVAGTGGSSAPACAGSGSFCGVKVQPRASKATTKAASNVFLIMQFSTLLL